MLIIRKEQYLLQETLTFPTLSCLGGGLCTRVVLSNCFSRMLHEKLWQLWLSDNRGTTEPREGDIFLSNPDHSQYLITYKYPETISNFSNASLFFMVVQNRALHFGRHFVPHLKSRSIFWIQLILSRYSFLQCKCLWMEQALGTQQKEVMWNRVSILLSGEKMVPTLQLLGSVLCSWLLWIWKKLEWYYLQRKMIAKHGKGSKETRPWIMIIVSLYFYTCKAYNAFLDTLYKKSSKALCSPRVFTRLILVFLYIKTLQSL